MKIAIIISEARYDIQSAVIRGILHELGRDGIEAYIFTCHSALGFLPSGEDPADDRTFMLLNYEEYDGFIFYADTIPDRALVNAIAQEIRKTGKPALSVKDRLEGIPVMALENVAGIRRIIDHLVMALHKQRIYFLSGPEYNEDATERLNAYLESLSLYGIEPKDGWIIYGDYHPHSGREAFKWWYAEKDRIPLPDAIVCANDEMAMGVCIEAKELGVKVPEDIAVSGFDNRVISVLCEPSLTTVAIPGYELGRACGRRLLEFLHRNPEKTPELIETQPIFRRSTNPAIENEGHDEAVQEIRRHYLDSQLHLSNLLDTLRFIEAEFASARTWEDFYHVIEAGIEVFEAKSFYIFTPAREIVPDDRTMLNLLRGEEEQTLKRDIELSVVFAFEEGHMVSYPPFNARTLIPDEILNRSRGGYYVIYPLTHEKRIFGYCAICNSALAYESEWIALLIQIISSAMENLQRKVQLEHMVNALNRLWIYDKLTGVYNRAGFFERSDRILQDADDTGKNIFVLFADLDRLKYVNDTYGHEAGDSFIGEIAGILKQVFYKDELIMRYGGDEFVVIAEGVNEALAKKYTRKINVIAENINSCGRYPFTLSVSLGYMIGKAKNSHELESLIEEADKLMYQVKEEKRALRKD
ncbi:MAG: GGDEF domain-containing protein [Lachnospiraceae bacterium]|nr:GGDEF domain-containing protein [Lachnospiraceae bacterium]